MKTTRYFQRKLEERALEQQWCERIVVQYIEREVQVDGRIRYWGEIPEAGSRILRVVTLEDGETLHNAFFDRGYKKDRDTAG